MFSFVPFIFATLFSSSWFLFFFFKFIYLFIYFWLCWVFVSVRGLSLVVARGGHSSSPCAGLSLPWPLLLRSTGSRRAGSVVVAHGPSCSVACGIFPHQGSEPVSSALAGRFSTTAPPGKPLDLFSIDLVYVLKFSSFMSLLAFYFGHAFSIINLLVTLEITKCNLELPARWQSRRT